MALRRRATTGAKGRGPGSDPIAVGSDASDLRLGIASVLGSENAIGIASVNGMAGKLNVRTYLKYNKKYPIFNWLCSSYRERSRSRERERQAPDHYRDDR